MEAKAKDHPVFFMVLGADLEFFIYLPDKTSEQRKQVKPKKKKSKKDGAMQQIEDGANPVTEAAAIIPDTAIWDVSENSKLEVSRATKDENLVRIKVTHGSVLIINDCDVDVRDSASLSLDMLNDLWCRSQSLARTLRYVKCYCLGSLVNLLIIQQ